MAIHPLPKIVDPRGILTADEALEVVQRCRDRALFHFQSAFTPAMNTFIGLYLDEEILPARALHDVRGQSSNFHVFLLYGAAARAFIAQKR